MNDCMQYEDFDINSFKTVVLNTIVGNNEIINILDKNYINCGGKLLYGKMVGKLKKISTKKYFHICRIQRLLEQMNLLSVLE